MGVAYAFLRPILASGGKNLATEKMQFLIVFIIFLAIETIVTIRILNDKG
jgi:TM2 domain-containing membrane protein YozV